MAILDIVLLACFIPAVVQGLTKGFIQQVISIVSIVIGIWLAHRLSSTISVWLGQYVGIEAKVLNVICFMVIVILAILLLYWVGELVTRVIKIVTLGWLNRLLGVIFAILKVAIILGVLIMVFESVNDTFHFVKPQKFANAAVYQVLRTFAHNILPWLKSYL